MKTTCPDCGQPTLVPLKDGQHEWYECDQCGRRVPVTEDEQQERQYGDQETPAGDT